MKALLHFVLPVLVSLFAFSATAQNGTTTVIIVRHAEKDTATTKQMMKSDPPLSKQGWARALSLINALEGFTPTAAYSSNYERTRSTLIPIADKFQLEIQLYDPRNQQALADKLKAAGEKTVIVAGHSNTVPKLVNLFLGENKYPDLDDSVYNQIYIVRITNGTATVEVREY